jgi:hypothetical protein
MATYKHLRSSTANKRPTTSIADGQLAINSNAASPGLFFKDSTGATIIKIGPVHVGTTAPNATPGAGGSSGNSTGEVWLDTSLTPVGVKIWNGSAWVNGTPTGSTTVQGLLELATDVETQTGSDTARAVTPASLQSKVSDSTSTTSSTTIASSTAVKSAFDLANAALPKSGGTVTGNLEIGTAGSLTFEGSVADGFETTIAVTNPTADRTITLPDTTGTIITTGDTGTVTSTMLLDGTIVNADVNASAAIAGTKIAPDFGSQTIQTTGIVSHALGTALAPTVTFTGDLNTGIYSPGADQVAISTNGTGRLFVDASGRIGINTATPDVFSRGDAAILGITSSGSAAVAVNAASGSNAFLQLGANGSRNFQILASATETFFQNAGANPLIFQTSFTERMRLDSSGRLGLGTSSPSAKLYVSDAGNTPSPSLTYGASASTTLLSGNVELASGLSGITPFSYWIQVRDSTNAGRNLVINPLGGNIGIGTTAPSQTLHLKGNILAEVDSGTANIQAKSGASATMDIGTTGAQHYLFGNGNFPLTFSTFGTERARIDSSGRLGLGTSAPSSVLHTRQDVTSGDYKARSILQNTDQKTIISAYWRSGVGQRSEIQSTNDAENVPGVLVLNPAGGNVGIGTTSPYSPLTVRGLGNNITLDLNSTTTNDYSAIIWNGSTVDVTANPTCEVRGYRVASAAGELGFHTRTAGGISQERARIDSSGRLLVGTSTAIANSDNNPNAKLHLHSSAYYSIDCGQYSADLYGTVINLEKSRSASVGSHASVSNGDQLGSIRYAGSDGTGFKGAALIEAYVDGTPGTNDMPGRLVFSTTADGASSPTERMRIDSNGFTRYAGAIGRGAPVTKTGAFTVGITENWLICNGTASITVTLPTASAWTGREIMLKTIAAFTVVSASSNVVPLAGGAAGTAILAATAGKFATLVSDGTNWIVMQAN